jgi:hypothetical protein
MTAVVKMSLKLLEMGNAHMFNVVASGVFFPYSSPSHEDMPTLHRTNIQLIFTGSFQQI